MRKLLPAVAGLGLLLIAALSWQLRPVATDLRGVASLIRGSRHAKWHGYDLTVPEGYVIDARDSVLRVRLSWSQAPERPVGIAVMTAYYRRSGRDFDTWQPCKVLGWDSCSTFRDTIGRVALQCYSLTETKDSVSIQDIGCRLPERSLRIDIWSDADRLPEVQAIRDAWLRSMPPATEAGRPEGTDLSRAGLSNRLPNPRMQPTGRTRRAVPLGRHTPGAR
jgi:hypothetical protein